MTQIIEPTANQIIVRVTENRGQHIYSVELPSGETTLTLLPAKFRNTIWIKRGDYLIIEDEETATPEKNFSGKIRSLIKYVLYADQIKHFKSTNNWPKLFEDKGNNKIVSTATDEVNEDVDMEYANPNRRYAEDDEEDIEDTDE